MITWRTVTGTDLANCNIESGGGLNDDEIFPRNAVGQLFNHYYKINDESEIMAFAGLIESYMRRDEYYCLFYGKQFRKILTYLRRKGRTVRARSLLQGYLFSLGVLCDDEGETISVGSFTGGHDSHSFQVTFFAEYVKVLIKDGDVIYLEAGSTCYEIIPYLANKKNLTIITNSLYLMRRLGELAGHKIIIIGGQYRPERMDMVGPAAELAISQLGGFKAFTGADDITVDAGISGDDVVTVGFAKLLVKQASEVVFVGDSTKFDKPALYKIADIDKLDYIVTDKRPSKAWLRVTKKKHIKLIYTKNATND